MFDNNVRATVLSNEPLVIYTGNYAAHKGDSEFLALSRALEGREVIFLMLVAWTAEFDSPALLAIVEWRNNYLRLFPKNRLIFLTNTYGEKNALINMGAEAEFVNHNIFVDETIFMPLSKTPKEFDAVYNGQFLPFKRHYLAEKIKSLAIIGYNFDTPYAEEVIKKIPSANFCNKDSAGDLKWLNSSEVNVIYNKSRTALCLSKAEGAMHASMEYLLAGLPVITTFSKGGRDYFFQGDYVFWVEDTPDAVEDAVHYVKKLDIDPYFIRERTIEKINKERNRFHNYLNDLCGGDEEKRLELANIWKENFNDKLIVPKKLKII